MTTTMMMMMIMIMMTIMPNQFSSIHYVLINTMAHNTDAKNTGSAINKYKGNTQKVKIKVSLYSSGQSQRVPGGLRLPDFKTIGT